MKPAPIRHLLGLRLSRLAAAAAIVLVLGPLGASRTLLPTARADDPPAHGHDHDHDHDHAEGLPNLDLRRERWEERAIQERRRQNGAAPANAAANPEVRQQAEDRLRAALPHLQLDRHPITGSLRWCNARDGFLTGPNGSGRGLPPNSPALAAQRPADPHRILRAFINEHAAAFGHTDAALDRARIARTYVTAHNGLRTTLWQQEHQGLEIFEAIFLAHLTRQDELVNVSSQFVPQLEQAAAKVAAPPQDGPGPAITAEQALRLAARSLEQAGSDLEPVQSAGPSAGVERRQTFTGGFVKGEALVRLLWLPVGADELRLCWRVLLKTRDSKARYRVLVDAETGEVWVRHNMTTDLSNASYRVFTGDSPTPFSPGYSSPGNTNQPAQVSRQLVTLSALNANASPNGWINDGDNETRGNNVDAHTDTNADDTPDTPRPQGSPSRVFDFPLDLTQAPSTYRPAAVVNLFYWCNWMHDRLWELGFTEDAGNFQEDNFGRGGTGNDAVFAQAQDGDDFNNANFSYTDADGERCYLQMFLWTGPNPDRDGDFEMEVILHEYAHGLSQRLVGGGVGITEFQSRALGEGWSDFFGLALLSQSSDNHDGVFARGAYSRFQIIPGFMENYYYGARYYPYSTDLTKNPLTFNDVDPAQQDLPGDVPSHPAASGFSGIHSYGTVWAVALWDARVNLIKKHGFTSGNQLILRLVVDGMKLTPANPTFLEARDAILQADQVLNAGSNHPELWRAFAKRGLGRDATSPGSATTAGVRESFEGFDDLKLVTPIPLSGQGPVGGPFDAPVRTFTLQNTGSSNLTWSVRLEPPLEASPTTGTLAPGASRSLDVSLDANAAAFLPVGTHPLAITFSNHLSRQVILRSYQLTVLSDETPTVEVFTTGSTFDLEGLQITFTPDGDGGYNVCRDAIIGFPVSTATATRLGFAADGFKPIQFGGGRTLDLFGQTYSSLYVREDGAISFSQPTSTPEFTLTEFLSKPGIAALYRDQTTNASGGIYWEQRSDRCVVTWDRIRSLGATATNRLQIEIFFDGVIRINLPEVESLTGITGLSRGNGVPAGSPAANFSARPDCDTPLLTLHAPAQLREGVPPRLGAASVSIPRGRSASTLVTLSSSDTTELTVPISVTIPSRETNAPIPLEVIDDLVRDGSQLVYLRAHAAGYVSALARVRVDDNENNPLTVALPLLASESQGTFVGTLSVPNPVSGTVSVLLESSDTNEATVPPVAFIPAGQTSITFSGQVVDDRRIERTKSVQVTATVPQWTSGSDGMTIFDNEDHLLRLQAPIFVQEGSGMLENAGRVYLSGTLETNLPIQLWTSNFFAVLPLGPVTIPAGQTNATFDISIGDNAEIEGLRMVTLTATSAGFTNANWNVYVLDNDFPPTPDNPHPPHLATGWPLDTHLSWNAAEGELLVNGNFETGDFTGWTTGGSGGGGWILNDGTVDPDSPDGPRPALAGAFGAISIQHGNGRRVLAQEVTIPDGATSGTLLRWRQEIRNHAGRFTDAQRFAVELRDPATDALLATLYSTTTNDPAFSAPTNRTASVAAWRGQRVSVQFVEEDALGDLNVHLDNISLNATSAEPTTYDVYFGYDASPDTSEFLGSTTNAFWPLPRLAGGLNHYWRIESRRLGLTNAGPTWRFTTAGSSTSTTPLTLGSAWKYVASGANLGTTWRGTNYNDAIWPTGTAPLGFGSSQVTTIGAASNDVTTFYFRRRLYVPDTNRLATVTAALQRDDGAIVYVNGIEAFRDNMPDGRFDYLTQASSIVSGADETNSFFHPIDPSLFFEGTNIIAVEVHQRDNGFPFPGPSTDLFFDLGLTFRTNTGNLAPLAVRWTDPADFTQVRLPTNLTLRASAIDDNLLGARMAFYAGDALLGEDSVTPFSVTWTNPPPGIHTLLAVVTDPGGLVRTSPPLHVLVAPAVGQRFLTFVPAGANWRYRANGHEPDRSWTGLNYVEPRDRSWAEGPAQLGYGDGDEATEFDFGFSFGVERDGYPVTAYFRHGFEARASLNSLRLRVLRDDGAAVYLNGVEVLRNNLPGGILRSNTLAISSIQPPFENTWIEAQLSPQLLAAGPNLVAAEIHQNSPTSGDLSFDLELTGFGNPLPTVELISPSANTSLVAPIAIQLAATAGDPYGSIALVRFLRNGAPLGQDTAPPYTFTWNNPPSGLHTLTAEAVDNLGASSTSAPVKVTIVPLVSLTARTIGTNSVELSWPESAPGYTLEATASLVAPVIWSPIATPETPVNGAFRVLVTPDDTQRFFRLRTP